MLATQTEKHWANTHVYMLAAICLVLGVAAGYLLHAPSTGTRTRPAQSRAAASTSVHPQVTRAQLQRIADTKARPLLAKLEASPNDAQLLVELGNIYFDTEQFVLAKNYYERAVHHDHPAPEVLTLLGNTYYYLGDTNTAVATFNRALAIDPKFANALYNLGMVKWQAQSDPQAAIEIWTKLLQSNPNHPQRAQVETMIARAKQHSNIPAGTKTDKPSAW
ncbi:MAG: tetratricopeptide repeat protein [Terriglobales bacterium]